MSRTTSILRNEDNELIAHSLAPMREYSGLKRTNKNVLPTADGKARLCATYTNHEKSLFCGNFNDNFCGLCKEPLHEVLVKCEKCHLEGRKMEVYHPTCSRLLNFQLCGRMYPDVVVAICPVHFDLSNDPKTDLKVGDSVVHKLNDEVHSLAEIVFIGKVNMEIILSFHGGYMECDKKQILECECKSLGCNGSHFPGYQVAVRNRGAIGVTLGIYRGHKLEQTYRIRHDDGQSVTCDRSEFFSLKDPNCPNEFKRLLNKRRAEKDLLERMNVPIKRERRTISGTGKEENSTLAEILKQIERSEQAANKTFISMKIKQEVEE
ncbi:[histone H3]-trimethyl-L-lysine(9) demethylase [Aphelenchoides bicaudatus]|nr:[histone H3]-trimethyl-L-lysine(9) demethylase [Aphelenchoides bicaudatus]